MENSIKVAWKVESKIMETRRSTTHNYKDWSVVAPSFPHPTRLTPQKLEEKKTKRLCYNCDRKYTKGHNCAEKKLFYIYCEEEEEKKEEFKSYEINQFQSISSSGRTYPLNIPHGRMRILYRSI